MPRTTLDLDPLILERLRERAAAAHTSMGAVASELLAAELHRSPRPTRVFRLEPLEMGRPSIDLEDKVLLWEILDGQR